MEFHISKSKTFMLVVFSIALTLGASYGVYLEKSLVWCSLGILFGVLGLIATTKQFMDKRPRIVMDPEGVEDITLGVGKIKWTDIDNAELMNLRQSTWLVMHIPDEALARYTESFSNFKKKALNANVAMGLAPLNINLLSLKSSPEEVFEKFSEFHQAANS